MGHPMHLHGHSFQVVELDGEILEDGPVRDTIQIPQDAIVLPYVFKRIIQVNGYFIVI